jgi:hypothetical protein
MKQDHTLTVRPYMFNLIIVPQLNCWMLEIRFGIPLQLLVTMYAGSLGAEVTIPPPPHLLQSNALDAENHKAGRKWKYTATWFRGW